MFCWHHIKNELNGLCPNCRAAYSEDPHKYSKVDKTELLSRQKKDKKAGQQQQQLARDQILTEATDQLPLEADQQRTKLQAPTSLQATRVEQVLFCNEKMNTIRVRGK